MDEAVIARTHNMHLELQTTEEYWLLEEVSVKTVQQ
jgi:hypothetical protein